MHRPSLRRNRPLRRPLRLQTLEDRTLLAGDVKAFVAGGNLFLFGDNAANEISLTRSGNGAITLSSIDGTTQLNHQTDDLTFNNVTDGIFIFTYDGADVVQLASDGDSPFRVGGGLFIATDGGADEIDLSNVVVAHGMTLLTGKGNDKILAPGNVLSEDIGADAGVIVRGVTIIVTGGGGDQVVLANSQFKKFALVDTVSGNDQLVLNNAAFGRTSVLIGGSGTDTLTRTDSTFHRGPIVISFENQGDALAPTAVNDTATVAEGGNQAINVASNDFDPDGNINPATITFTQAPAHGTAVANPNGTVTYTHDGSETTSDSFKYTIKDASGKTSNVATVNVTVTPVNDPPVAVADAATLPEGGNTAVNVAANDTDAEGNGTINLGSITIVTPPQHGTAVPNANGTVTYTHDGGETTTDSFTYTIKDNPGATSNTATATLTITPVNDNPVAVADTNSIAEDGAASVAGNVLTNDTDAENDTLVVTGPGTFTTPHGSITIAANGSYTYTLNNADPAVNALAAGQTLTDSYTYAISDGHGGTATATLTVTITGHNDDPVAVADTNSITEDGAATVAGNVLTNDTDPEGDTLVVIGPGTFTTPHGSITIAADGSYTYTLNNADTAVNALAAGETLTDSYTYAISDGHGGTATATLTITITGHNDDPVGVADTNSIDEDGPATVAGNVLTNDTDPESDTLVVSGPGTFSTNHGSITINADGSYVYTLNNADVLVDGLNAGETLDDFFTYAISDGNGGADTGTLTITIHGNTDAA